jgi:hypothetical protein
MRTRQPKKLYPIETEVEMISYYYMWPTSAKALRLIDVGIYMTTLEHIEMIKYLINVYMEQRP